MNKGRYIKCWDRGSSPKDVKGGFLLSEEEYEALKKEFPEKFTRKLGNALCHGFDIAGWDEEAVYFTHPADTRAGKYWKHPYVGESGMVLIKDSPEYLVPSTDS